MSAQNIMITLAATALNHPNPDHLAITMNCSLTTLISLNKVHSHLVSAVAHLSHNVAHVVWGYSPGQATWGWITVYKNGAAWSV